MGAGDRNSHLDHVRRARRVVLQVTIGLVLIMCSALLALSGRRVTEFDLCTTTIDLSRLRDLDGEDAPVRDVVDAIADEPVTVDVPCNQRTVTTAAAWRWPAIAVIGGSIALAGALRARSAPRWIRREDAIDAEQRIVPLGGRQRGDRTHYRLMPLHAAVMTAIAVAIAVTAPWTLGALALLPAAACGWVAGSATVSVGPTGLKARTYVRLKHWTWDEIRSVRAEDSTYGRGGIPSRRLVIDLVGKRSFSNESLCSTAVATPSRTDQLVESIRAYRANVP